MRTCYIHIGVHKTGSTSIQHSLARHRDKLRAHGVCVPRSGAWSPSVAAHHHLAFEINKSPAFAPSNGGMKDLLAELRAETSDKILLSSEDLAFCVKHPARLRKLRDPLVALGYEIVWIVYFRTFPDWAESAYTELAKSLNVRTNFEDWVRSNPRALALGLDPCGMLRSIRKSGDKVLLRSYSEAGGNLLGDFYQLLGVPASILGPADHDGRVNQRVSVFAMEFLTRLASHPAVVEDPQLRIRFRERAMEELRKLPAGPAYRGLFPGLARTLYQATKPTYRRLLRQFRPETTVEELFPLSREYNPMTLDLHDAAPEELLRLYRAIADLCLAETLC